MKNFIAVFFLLLTACAHGADSQGRAKFNITGIPANNDTLTFRGVTRTWKTTVTSSSTQIQIGGSAAASANNLVAHLNTFQFASVAGMIQESTVNITLIADVNVTVTASVVGAWGTVTVTTTPLTQRTIAVPFASESVTVRTNNANELILAFNYSSSAFAASVAAMSNYVNVTLAQTVTGLKSFSSIGVTDLGITNAAGAVIVLKDTGGTANDTIYKIVADGDAFKVGFYNDAGTLVENFLSATRDAGAVVTTSIKGDDIQIGDAISIIGSDIDIDGGITGNTLEISGASTLAAVTATTVTATTFSGNLTNGVVGASTIYTTTNLNIGGNLNITNNAPIISIYDGDGGANGKLWRIESGGATIQYNIYTDAGAFGATVAEFTRIGTDISDAGFTVYGTFQTEGATAIYDGLTGDGGIETSGYFVSGAGAAPVTPITPPAGLTTGFYFGNGTDVSTDSLSGGIIWALNGLKYRTETADEGTGQVNRIHNRSENVQGSGTDYTLTSSTAAVDFGTTDPNFTAPTAGTYLIVGTISITAGAADADSYRWKLRNTTAAADISGSDGEVTFMPITTMGQFSFFVPDVTLAASDVVALYAHNNTAARGTINSARTRIGFVRLH